MEPGSSRRLLVVVVLSMLLTASVSVFVQSDAPKANSVRWLTYVDPRFDFSIKYPSDWQVIPRDDSDPEAMSGLLKFVPSVASEVAGLTNSSDDPQGSGAQVVVGLYLAELEAGQSLSEWTDLYESLGYDSDEALVQRRPRKVIRVKGVTAVHEEGVSLVTPYQFTNLTHGRTVWFIWTNIPSGSEAPDSSVYRKMVRSFRFGKNAPSTLQEVYGFDFEPLNLEL